MDRLDLRRGAGLREAKGVVWCPRMADRPREVVRRSTSKEKSAMEEEAEERGGANVSK